VRAGLGRDAAGQDVVIHDPRDAARRQPLAVPIQVHGAFVAQPSDGARRVEVGGRR